MKRFLLVGLVILSLLPGCHLYREWITESLYQADKIDVSFTKIRNDYIRSKRLYDGFTTVELFDLFWYAPSVYDVVGLCSNQEDSQDLDRAYYKDHVVLYVFMNSLHNEWNFTLLTRDNKYKPVYQEPVVVGGNLKHLLGEEIMCFKRTVYRLVFDVEVAGSQAFDVCVCNGLHQSAISFNKGV